MITTIVDELLKEKEITALFDTSEGSDDSDTGELTMIEIGENDYYYDVRIYKDEIEGVLDRVLEVEEFNMIMESFDVFHVQEMIHGYIKQNSEIINLLLDDESKGYSSD